MNLLEKEKALPLYFKDIEAKQNKAHKKRKYIGIITIILVISLPVVYLFGGISSETTNSLLQYHHNESKSPLNPEYQSGIPLSSSPSNSYNSADEELHSANFLIDQIGSRDDKTSTSTSSSSSNSSNKKSTPIYDLVGVRIGFVLVGFVLLNMIAIVIHHIFLKVSRAGQSYKNVELHYSPF